MPAIAVKKSAQVARPLKVLVPLIKNELEAGDRAGLEHYRRAGELLIEAKEQQPYGQWGKWLSKNFDLSPQTANRYMRLATLARRDPEITHNVSNLDYASVIGDRRDRQEVHGSWRRVTEAAQELDAELFAQERQTRDDEIRLHRELALELVDLGYKAMATRLHPDRGGSKDAMARLNRVRDELKQIAETRRFV